MERIYFIILNYNNYDDTVECVESIENNTYGGYQIVLVDNKSPDGSGSRLAEKFPSYPCLLLETNDGYAAGNNAGIRYAMEQGADYICVLNNDVVLPAWFVGKALEVMVSRRDYDIISPLVCEYDRPDYVQSAGATHNLIDGSEVLLHKGELADEVDLTGDKPDYLGGACFIARREAFEKNGLIPEFYFLFLEETDWFFSARAKGMKYLCDAGLRVYHKGSATIGKVKGLSQYYMARNQVIFSRRKCRGMKKCISYIHNMYLLIHYFIKNIKHPHREYEFLLKGVWHGLHFKIIE